MSITSLQSIIYHIVQTIKHIFVHHHLRHHLAGPAICTLDQCAYQIYNLAGSGLLLGKQSKEKNHLVFCVNAKVLLDLNLKPMSHHLPV